MSAVIVCVPVLDDDGLDPRWGRAARVAVAEVTGGVITGWTEHAMGWDGLHDAGTEGGHHARVARFLVDHGVQAVVANHMGPGMVQMLERMRLAVHLGARGDARQAVVEALARPH